MSEASYSGAGIHRLNRIGAQRAKAHGRYVEYAHVVRVFAVFASEADTRVMIQGMKVKWFDGVGHPLISFGIDVELRPEGSRIDLLFGALINYGPIVAINGSAVD